MTKQTLTKEERIAKLSKKWKLAPDFLELLWPWLETLKGVGRWSRKTFFVHLTERNASQHS